MKKNTNVLDFIQSKGLDPKTVVVEYNLNIVKSDKWSGTILKENDSLEVLSFVGGGDILKSNLKDLFENELYCITAEDYSNGKSNVEVVKELISSGVKIIQYREKDKKPLYKYEECVEIRKLTKDSDVTFIVNDDIDIAILVKADGVHIGQEDLPIEKVRELVGNSMIIGLSTHSSLEAKDAVERGADYIGVGPIFKTQTKVDVVDPVGFDYLDYVVENINIPFVAIGGIKEHNLKEVVDHGAKCVCLVSEIVGARDISEKVKSVKDIIDKKS